MMKTVKIIFLALALIIITGLVVWFSDGGADSIEHSSDPTVMNLNKRTDMKWSDIDGWSQEAYNYCKESIERKKNDGYINNADAAVCLNHLNETALNKTSRTLDSLYAMPTCTQEQIDRQIPGIREVAKDPDFSSDQNVERQIGIYKEYCAALVFASSSYVQPTGYSFPSSWNNYSGQPFRQRAETILHGRYWSVIKNITPIKNGLSESTIASKIAAGRNNFATTLGNQIVAAFKSRSYTYDNFDLLSNAVGKYRGQGYSNGSLNSFYSGYYERIAPEN